MKTDTTKMILIVEDDQTERFVLSSILQRVEDYKVVSVGSAEEALRQAQQRQVDLLLTDMQMPKMDGACLTEAFLELTPHTKVIWLTASGCDAVTKCSQSSGIACCLDKPVTLQQLRSAVQASLSVTY